jgi:hypothetical protein
VNSSRTSGRSRSHRRLFTRTRSASSTSNLYVAAMAEQVCAPLERERNTDYRWFPPPIRTAEPQQAPQHEGTAEVCTAQNGSLLLRAQYEWFIGRLAGQAAQSNPPADAAAAGDRDVPPAADAGTTAPHNGQPDDGQSAAKADEAAADCSTAGTNGLAATLSNGSLKDGHDGATSDKGEPELGPATSAHLDILTAPSIGQHHAALRLVELQRPAVVERLCGLLTQVHGKAFHELEDVIVECGDVCLEPLAKLLSTVSERAMWSRLLMLIEVIAAKQESMRCAALEPVCDLLKSLSCLEIRSRARIALAELLTAIPDQLTGSADQIDQIRRKLDDIQRRERDPKIRRTIREAIKRLFKQ